MIQRDLITTLLQFDTKYYYAVGTEQTMRKFWFRTPPKSGPDVPYTFGLIGIVGYASIYMLVVLYQYTHSPNSEIFTVVYR